VHLVGFNTTISIITMHGVSSVSFDVLILTGPKVKGLGTKESSVNFVYPSTLHPTSVFNYPQVVDARNCASRSYKRSRFSLLNVAKLL
jgi:hypothetical protein